jgi:hypothetical protein
MSIAISAASTSAPHLPPVAPAARPAPVAQATAAGPPSAQQTTALNHALATYRSDLQQGQPASSLTALARQIAADAKALGQRVALPTGTAPASAPAAAHAATPVNVVA